MATSLFSVRHTGQEAPVGHGAGRMEIAKFFKYKRLACGISITTAAEALGFKGEQELISYESGSTAIPLEDIFALTNLLNIAPEDVLGLIYDVCSGKERNR